MTFYLVPVAHVTWLRILMFTDLHALFATCMELTPCRWIGRRWDIPLQTEGRTLQAGDGDSGL